MTTKSGVEYCDFCYNGAVLWDAEMECRAGMRDGISGWTFSICDSCRVLLRNVIGPVLHRVSHTDLVAAIVALMASRGLEYQDLMQPLREINSFDAQRSIETVSQHGSDDVIDVVVVEECRCIEIKGDNASCPAHNP